MQELTKERSYWPDLLREKLERMADELSASLSGYREAGRVFTPEEYGFISGEAGRGNRRDTCGTPQNAAADQPATQAIQCAIDAAAAAGGGTVLLACGD